MEIVDYKTYEERRLNFLKNNPDLNRYTFPMVDNEYHTEWMNESGAGMWEHNTIMTVTKEVEIGSTKMSIDVKVIRHELWDTTNSEPSIMYEKY